MERMTILLEEDQLLEIQQLAKEYDMTSSQVVLRAISTYLDSQSQIRRSPQGAKGEFQGSGPSRGMGEPIRYVRETEPAGPIQTDDPGRDQADTTAQDGKIPRGLVVPLALGTLSAILALFEAAQAVGQFARGAYPLGVVINYGLPAILLGAVAAAFLFLADQNRRLDDM